MEQKLTKVFLHGRLGKLYGKEWNLAVRSPAEALRAINSNVNGRLREQLQKEGTKKFYKICLGNTENALDKNEAINPSGNVDIHIIPVIKGKKSGWAKILVAVAIIASIMYPPLAPYFYSAGKLTLPGYIAVATATSLLLGGVQQLLTPVPSFNQNSEGDGRGSNIFQGNSSIVSQGSTVGLVYGKMLVTPMPISLSFDNYEISLPSIGDPSECEPRTDDNGIITYTCE
jgi:predicted phage tail protein